MTLPVVCPSDIILISAFREEGRIKEEGGRWEGKGGRRDATFSIDSL